MVSVLSSGLGSSRLSCVLQKQSDLCRFISGPHNTEEDDDLATTTAAAATTRITCASAGRKTPRRPGYPSQPTARRSTDSTRCPPASNPGGVSAQALEQLLRASGALWIENCSPPISNVYISGGRCANPGRTMLSCSSTCPAFWSGLSIPLRPTHGSPTWKQSAPSNPAKGSTWPGDVNAGLLEGSVRGQGTRIGSNAPAHARAAGAARRSRPPSRSYSGGSTWPPAQSTCLCRLQTKRVSACCDRPAAEAGAVSRPPNGHAVTTK